MGYRSDVAMVFRTDDFKEMCKYLYLSSLRIKEGKSDAYTAYDLVKDSQLSQYDNRYTSLYWNSVKWYEGYSDIDELMEYVKSKDIPYGFVRVGESPDDVEVEYKRDDECDYDLCAVISPCTTIDIQEDTILRSLSEIFDEEENAPPQNSEPAPMNDIQFDAVFNPS